VVSSRTTGIGAGGRGSRVWGGDLSGRVLQEGTDAWVGSDINIMWLACRKVRGSFPVVCGLPVLSRRLKTATRPVRASVQTAAAANLGPTPHAGLPPADPGLVFGLTPEVAGCAPPRPPFGRCPGLTPRGHRFAAESFGTSSTRCAPLGVASRRCYTPEFCRFECATLDFNRF
jgi:hypothetical protein